ncbi:MAG: alanine--glyoxylate aminotransferase family protein [Planctomycetota bacterium]
MMKYRLVTPGPAMVPAETLLELAKPVRHHRTAENKALVAEAMDLLKRVMMTSNDVVLLTSSGTGAMETAVANFIKPGDTAIAIVAGKWGERWAELCKSFGANLVTLSAEYGKVVTPDQLAAALKQHPNTVAVYGTLCDTSTAVAHDIEAMGKIVAATPALFAVDGISGLGAMECRTDDWHIDLMVTGSQKALMLPPGLAYLAVSAKAKKVLESNPTPPTYYFNLKQYLKSAAAKDTPYTPAHTLIAAQVQSLRLMLEEGLEKVWANSTMMSRALLKAVEALGLKSLAERPATALTAVLAPSGIDAEAWAKLLEKKYQVKVAGGQGSLKGKIIRIAHMGYVDPLDLLGIVAAMEWSLKELGHPVELGKAVAIATKSLGEDLAKG